MIKRFLNLIRASSSLYGISFPGLFAIVIVVTYDICGDITFLSCHLTLQEHAIKWSPDLMEGSSSLYVTILPGLVTRGIVVVKK